MSDIAFSSRAASTASHVATIADAPSRYICPPEIEIRPLTDAEARALYSDDTSASSTNSGRLLLFDASHTSHLFVLNDVIAQYLQLFREPSTPLEAAERLAASAGCDVATILPTTTTFFKSMRETGVLQRAASRDTLRTAPLVIEIGQRVGNYRVSEIIVDKSDVTLCRAERVTDGERVVLKILTSPYRNSEELREEFRHEFELMRSLAPHPSVCRFLAYEDGEIVFAVLEDVDGRPLRRQFQMPVASLVERLGVCREASDALAHLHAHGVLHGDVHARNFLRDARGHVRLIDFGLACTVDEGGPDGDVIHGGVPLFMPPERIREGTLSLSDRPGDLRSEVYQLGVLCYEVLSGDLPFASISTWNQLAHAIREIMPPRLTATPESESIPEHVADVVERAMAKKPRARFSSAVEFRDALRVVACA